MKNKVPNSLAIRYVIAGGISYVIELTFLLLFNKVLNLSVELSTAIAFWIGLLFSFLLQKVFAFSDYRKELSAISRQIGSYMALVLFNYVFTIIVVSLFPASKVIISRTLALIITTAWNYFIYKRIFSDTKMKKLGKKVNTVQFFKRSWMGLVITLPVILFFWQYIVTPNKTLVGDFDYYSQMYEAFRISLLHYHQLPLWNPWMAGGVPLINNPQFGLISLQSILVIPFGAIYGMKLAYVLYGIAGFWGMYVLGRRAFSASPLRSILVGYVWVFCGFFASHNISHYTFASFFLLPWLVYFFSIRSHKYGWLWMGLIESAIILNSIHYAFLMTGLALAALYFFDFFKVKGTRPFGLHFVFKRSDLYYFLKAFLVVAILAGYRFITTYYFVSHNQRPTGPYDESVPIGILFKAIFLPMGTWLNANVPHTHWSWGEYSMYLGLGTGMAIIVIIAGLTRAILKKNSRLFSNPRLLISCLLVGLMGFLLALGSHGRFSPFELLHHFPGFKETRVPSRWLVLLIFSLLTLLLSYKQNQKLINFLLFISIVELFISYGPPRINGSGEINVPKVKFNTSFEQYDNGYRHLDADRNIMHSYLYTTSINVGQVYADDSLIDTLDRVYGTSRCGLNLNQFCTFVLTHNAKINYWSPNEIRLTRTSPGPIELNMNVDAGWRVNNVYPYVSYRNLDPSRRFILTDGKSSYDLVYAPKLSPSWIVWRLHRV